MVEGCCHMKLDLAPLLRLYADGQYPNLVEQVDLALAEFPETFELYNIKGAALAAMSRTDDSINSYKKALKINRKSAETHNNLAAALQDKGDIQAAIRHHKTALRLNPNFAEAHNNLGNALVKSGKAKQAGACFQRAIALAPQYSDAYYNLANLLKDNMQYDAAIAHYQAALKIRPDVLSVVLNLGNAHLAKKDQDSAIACFRQVIGLRPEHSEAHNNLAMALHEKGELDEAAVCYRKAHDLNPSLVGAKHLADALNGVTTDAAPHGFVQSLFDSYASTFEASLIDGLNYETPKLIAKLLPFKDAKTPHGRVLDLGCGTGLVGEEVRPFVQHLVGIDVSQKMLDQAAAKKIYDELIQADIDAFLGDRAGEFDVFIAGDVFVYIGDLGRIFKRIKSKAAAGGRLIFSTEHMEAGNFSLLPSGRYAHSQAYIEGLCQQYGYAVSHFSLVDLRLEKQQYLKGGLYVLTF